jgi:hypothetical protein
MVRFIEIAAPMLIVAYAAMYVTMRYLFPPEVRRWSISLMCLMRASIMMQPRSGQRLQWGFPRPRPNPEPSFEGPASPVRLQPRF